MSGSPNTSLQEDTASTFPTFSYEKRIEDIESGTSFVRPAQACTGKLGVTEPRDWEVG